ncbi:MAG: serine/threonine-protein phosphatase, partial [Ardenticatenales bacterium]|nr:serine/threonine-protein phosphatase [Ardenticatenales bacterium]
MQITSHLLSDVGRVRRLNEDNVRIVPASEERKRVLGDLYILADGMGGHEAGEVASEMAVDTIAQQYHQHPGPPHAALRRAIKEANRAIYQSAQEEERYGMGTTVVVAAVVGETLYTAHVGDSRIYLIRGGEISQLTRDHSLVAEQIEAGLLSPEEAAFHPHRN